MKFKTDGLIIFESAYGDKDRYVSVLTRKKGVIRAVVKGAFNLKSQKSSATRLLCYSDFIVYENGERYYIDSAESKEMFVGLRNDVVKMSLAQYFCQLCYELCPSDAFSEGFLRTMLNSLYVLANGNKPNNLVKAVFEMRMLALAGYMPDLTCCKGCGEFENEKMLFVPQEDCIYCEKCRDMARHRSVCTGLSVTAALRHSIYAEDKKIFSFSLSEEALNTFSSCAEDYLISKIEKKLPTLDFYKTISIM